MAQNDKNLQGIYNTLKKEGYNPPAYDEFVKDMQDDKNLQGVRNTLVKHGYTPPEFSKFKSDMFGAPAVDVHESAALAPLQPMRQMLNPEVAAEMEGRPLEGGWQPTVEQYVSGMEAVRQGYDAAKRSMDEREAAFGHMVELNTAEGQRKVRDARERAMMHGVAGEVVGARRHAAKAENDTEGGAVVEQPAEVAVTPNNVVARDVKLNQQTGQWETVWQLPDGSLTTNRLEAERWQGDVNRIVDERRKAEEAMRKAEAARERDIERAVDAVWKTAEDEDSHAEDDKNFLEDVYIAGFRNPYGQIKQIQRAIARKRRFDSGRLADEALSQMSNERKQEMYDRFVAYFGTEEGKMDLKGRSVEQAAADALRSNVQARLFRRLENKEAPEGKTSFFMNRLLDGLGWFSGKKQSEIIGSIAADSWDETMAREAAMQKFEGEHKALGIAGTVGGMLFDPFMWVSGGVGGVAGKAATKFAGKQALLRYGGSAMAKHVPLFARTAGAVAGGAANFGAFETLKDAESQLMHGGTVNGDGERTGEFSLGELMSSGVRGIALGGAVGATGFAVGNVGNWVVKKINSVPGKAAARGGQTVVSAVAEGTVFAVPDLLNENDPRSVSEILTDSYAMMAGFKLSHLAQGALKGAPSAYAALKAKMRGKDIDLNAKAKSALDGGRKDVWFSDEEIDELLGSERYSRLYDVLLAKKDAAAQKQMSDAGVEEVGRRTPVGYDLLETMLADTSISESTRARAYALVIGRTPVMSTIMGRRVDVDEQNGAVTVTTTNAHGGAVVIRRFGSMDKAQRYIDEVDAQLERNTIDMGERHTDAAVEAKILEEACAAVADAHPEGAMNAESVWRAYEAAKRGGEKTPELERLVLEVEEELRSRVLSHNEESSAAIRERISEELDVDVDKALAKRSNQRSEKEVAAIEVYAAELYKGVTTPNDTHDARSGAPMERSDAYLDGRNLYRLLEQGDPNAIKKAEEYSDRLAETYAAAEESFGADADIYTGALMHDPWSLLNDASLTDGQRAAVLEYINAREAVEGINDAAGDAAEAKREAVRLDVEKRVHKETGRIHPLTLKADGRQVYLVSGDVVMNEGSKGVNLGESSSSLIVYDPLKGKCEFTSPKFVRSAAESIDARSELESALGAIDAELVAVVAPQAAVAGAKTAVEGAESANNSVTLQPESNGDRPEQNNDEQRQADGSGVAADSAGGVATDRDRSDIRVYEARLGTPYNEYSEHSARARRESESERLIGIAKDNGQYKPREAVASLGRHHAKPSGESEVFVSEDNKRVYKVKDPYAKAPMKGRVQPEEAIYEHLVHNKYFPETAYRFEGISDEAGDVRIVLSQEFVESADKAMDEQVEAALAEKGLKREGPYTFGNDEISVTDVTGDNALVGADGRVYFIDPVIDFKKPAREILGDSGIAEAQPADKSSVENEAQAEQSALARIPLNEAGKPDFAAADAPTAWDALVEKTERMDVAQAFAEMQAKRAEAALAKARKAKIKDTDDIDEFTAAQQEHDALVEQAQACLGRWQEIVNEGKARAAAEKARVEREKTLERQERAEDSANRPGMYSKVMEHWAEPTSAYEYMLRALAGGGVKLRWNDSEHSKTHGLGAHIVGGDNLRKSWRGDTEYGARKWMIDDKSGFWPEEYAERVCQDYYQDYENDTDHFQEVFGDLLDICLSKPTSRAMYEAAREMHAAKDTRRYSEADLMAMQHFGVDTPEEADFADQYGMRYWEYEEESLMAYDSALEKVVSTAEYSEIMSIFDESKIEEYESSRQNSVDEPRGVPGVRQGGGRVLQEAQPDVNGGIPEDIGEAGRASGGGAVLRADGAAQAAPGAEGAGAGVPARDAAGRRVDAPALDGADGVAEPTEAQKAAGNYKKEHRRIDGYNISIENARGSVRRGTDADGKAWETTMQNDYGYIRGTEGVDGDHIDVFLSDTPDQGDVFVVDQVNVDGSFDEHKVMYGFPTEEAAREAYLSNYKPGWTGLGAITHVSKEEFKKWIGSSKRKTKPFAEYKGVKAVGSNGRSASGGGVHAADANQAEAEMSVGEGVEANREVYEAAKGMLEAAGVRVHEVEAEQAQAMLGERNGDEQLMGSRTDRKMEQIAEHFAGMDLDANQRAVVDVFSGKRDNVAIEVGRVDGKRRVVMRQGREPKAGTKHSLYRHYGAEKNYITADDIAMIPEVIANGERSVNGNKIVYDYTSEDGVRLRVTTEISGRQEKFTNLLSNRKPLKGGTRRPSKGDTQSSAQASDSEVLNAKVGKKFHIGNSAGQDSAAGSSPARYIGRDKEYFEAIECGDMDEAQRLVNEAARESGYSPESDYQGTSAFNGAAPYNGYGLSKEERRQLWETRELEGDWTLGDDIDFMGEDSELHFLLNHRNGYASASPLGRTSIIALRNAINSGTRKIKVYRSVPSDVKENSLRDGDWVTPSREYAKDNADVHGWGSRYRIIEQEVDFDELWWNGNDINEWGYDSGSNMAYKNTKNNRKLLDTITYDDAGNIIPLSKRFNSKKGDVRFMRTSGGEVYGWTVGGEVYLNRDAMNPETPVHEYTHLWDKMVQQENPELWARGKELLKQTPLWDEVVNDPNYANIRDDEDAVASEVHSRLTGASGAKILGDMIEQSKKDGVFALAERVTLVEQLRQWLRDMFKALKGTLEKWSKRELGSLTLEDFANMTLRDLAQGVNPRRTRRGTEQSRSAELSAAMARGREDFDAMRERAIAERGVVMPGLNEAEVRVVEVPRHDFVGDKPIAQARKWAKEHIVGGHTLIDSRGEEVPYTISAKSIDKYLSETAIGKSANMGMHLAALKKLPEIISESIEAEIHPDYTKNIHSSRSVENEINPDNLIHRFYGAALIDGQIYRVKTTIIENGVVQKNKPHSYEVTAVELINDAESQPDNHGRIGRPRFSEEQQMELTAPDYQSSVAYETAKLLKGVEKSYDSGKKLLDESGDVVLFSRGREDDGMRSLFDLEPEYISGKNSVFPDANQNMTPISDLSRVLGHKDYAFYSEKQIEGEGARRARLGTEQSRRAQDEAAMALSSVRELAGRLNLGNVEVVEDVSALDGERAAAKGFYNKRTGKITIVLPNNTDAADAVQTLLHEAVAHHGLRRLFGENFDTFLDNVYESAEESIRRKIADMVAQNDWDFRKATEEYLAGLAEETNFEEAQKSGWWSKIKQLFMGLLDKIVLKDFKKLGVKLTDNELRYILWRSYENLRGRKRERGIFEEAEDIAKQSELKVGNYAESGKENGKLYEINERFNSELKQYEAGALPQGHRFELGMPSGCLLSAGFPNLPITMRSSLLARKAGDEKHPFEASDIKGLVAAMQKPIAIFEYTKSNMRNLIVDVMRGNKHFLVGVTLNYKAGDIEINSVSGLFPKESHEWVKWIQDGKAIRIDQKDKVQEIIASLRTNPAESERIGLNLDNAAKIVNSFENPAIGEQKDNAEGEILFRKNQSLGEILETAKWAAAFANRVGGQKKEEAVRALNGSIRDLRKAMARQREYDAATVMSVTELSKMMLEQGLLDDLSKGEIKRLLGVAAAVTGKTYTAKYVQKVLDVVIDNQLRSVRSAFSELVNTRGSKVNARGIEVQAELDPRGQRIVEVVRATMNLPRGEEKDGAEPAPGTINYLIAEALDRMGNENSTIAENAAIEYSGLQVAHQYAESIAESKAEEMGLRKSIKDAKDDYDAGFLSQTEYKEFVEESLEAIRENKLERIEAYGELSKMLGDTVHESAERAKQWREAEKERVHEIQHNANSDMEGREFDEHKGATRRQKIMNNDFVRLGLAPLATFDQMLRMFGQKNVSGEGYLWNRFVREGWLSATENEYLGYRDALKELDAKVSEVFGKDMKWGDLFAIDRKLPKGSVKFYDGGEMKEHELTQGNLLYIYMANKMSDGRMKLRYMGITEAAVAEIERTLDPRFIKLADWMQDEFLVGKREKYNEVHERMFGAPMAAIENYFPLKILANARTEKVDVAEDTGDAIMPATTTGSIIKRRRNNLALDITGANAFSVVLDHIQQMEHWAAYAEFNRDLNTLLSYKRFRNQVKNMTSAYGGGKVLWTNFRKTAQMAAGSYRPPVAGLDKAAVNIAKGVTAAKVSFRLFTALKQLLSMPAFFSESNMLYLAKGLANPKGSWKWAMENLPLFEKRVKSRTAGDPRLMKTEMDWEMWRSRIVELASRVGMAPNAFVDALTVSIGARAVYDTKLRQYKRMGYDEATADRRAKQDATIAFNLSQQSSEGAFLSTMQVDRSWLSVMLTVFRNSSMSYTRQAYDAARNLRRMVLQPGYKTLSVEFMAKQMVRDGIDPAKATENAKREYRRGILRDLVRVAVYAYGLQLLWNLGASLPYLILGKDDDEKEAIMKDALRHSAFGAIEGLTGGDALSAAGNMLAGADGDWKYVGKSMPLTSDISNILVKLDRDKYEAMNDVINLLAQTTIGVNPQSLTDAVVAIMDVCDGDPVDSRECAMLVARILNCPQSQLDKIYFEEFDLTGDEVRRMAPAEIAERYAEYKMLREAPLTGHLRSEEERAKIRDKKMKRVTEEAKARIEKRIESEELKQLLAERDSVLARKKALVDLRDEDPDAYWAAMRDLMESGAMYRSRCVGKYNSTIKELTKQYLNAKTPEEADTIVEHMFEARDQLLNQAEESASYFQ